MRVFVAGATGVLGRPLVRELVAAGHEVTGMTRTPAKLASIEAAGAAPTLCDALDRDAVHAAVAAARPEVVVHQLTDLPSKPSGMVRSAQATNRLREQGTRYLVDAAKAAGARRVVAESIAFLYAPTGPGICDEEAPVWRTAGRPYGSLIRALVELENAVTGTTGIEGVVLRYGMLYGPGTWFAPDGALTAMVRKRRLPVVGDGSGLISFLHVDDAATATMRALDSGAPGCYNVVDDQPVTFREFVPGFAKLLGAKKPWHVPGGLLRAVGGAIGVELMTRQRGASNSKALRELGWTPRYRNWRDGFAADFSGG